MKERSYLIEAQPSARAEGSTQATDSSAPVLAPTGIWSRFTARIRTWFEVPFGYEDESGFHYGSQAAPPKARLATEAASVRARVLTDRADHVMKHSVVLPVANPSAPEVAPVAPDKTPATVSH